METSRTISPLFATKSKKFYLYNSDPDKKYWQYISLLRKLGIYFIQSMLLLAS